MSGTAFPTTDILLAGIGGQGVLTASEILAQAAIAQGFDVKKTEVAGMAQRGGMVTSHLRFGEKVMAPAIAPGSADLLLAFEVAEGLRCLPFLRKGGRAVVNTQRVLPPVVSSGLFSYPDDPVAQMLATGADVHPVDGTRIALALGEPRLANTVMLGAVADHLPFGAEALLRALLERFGSRKPHLADLNRRAFEAGREAVGGGAAQAAASA